MPRTSRSSRPLERILPLGFIGTALALAVLLLPTILRPPQDLQSTTAAFSPDAPPEETPPEALLQSLRQASSSTAGAKVEQVEQEVIVEEVVVQEAPPRRKAVRPTGCFGDPPRQTESLYSALCVPAWTGTDNGGATSPGVTATEINIAVAVGLSAAVQEGPLGRDFEADDAEIEHLLKVWQTYFNDRFEFYGRYLQFHIYKVSDQEEDQARSQVRAAASAGRFAFMGNDGTLPTAAAAAEAVRNKMITWIPGQNPVDFYKDSHPYAYSFTMDSWQTRALGPELICKHYANRPLRENLLNAEADPTFDYNAPRRFGLVLYQDEVRAGAREMYERNLAKCGVDLKQVHEYNLTDNQAAIAGTMARMRQANVTTVILAVDPLTPPVLAREAAQLAYSPEYIGVTGTSANATGRLMEDAQSEHLVSIASGEIPRADEDKDWYRAFKEIDPEAEPDPAYFRSLQQLAGAIQHAGPNLTPQTFWNGLKSQPCRTPEPIWSIGGCYGDPNPKSDVHYLGDYTYSDYVSLQWFDNAGDDPDSTSAGAFCFMNMGARYRLGELPTDPLPWRKLDQCIHTPPRGEQG